MFLKKVQLQDCKVKVGLEKPTCRCFTSHWARPQWDQWPGGPLCFWCQVHPTELKKEQI